MTPLNDDLVRAALSAGAGAIDDGDLRPLTLPRRRPRRWAIPAFTAAAVLATSVAIVVPRLGGTGAPAMSLAAYSGAKFVVEGAWPLGGKELTISKVSSGKTVAKVAAPRGSSGFLDADGAGDNRTFYVTTGDTKACRVDFHRLTLRDTGVPEGLDELRGISLPGRQGEGPDQLAVAKGGHRLAYSSLGCGAESDQGRITVVNLDTGARQAVDLPHGARANALRWAPDGRRLAYELDKDGWEGPRLSVLDSEAGVVSPIVLGPAGTTLHIGMIAQDGTSVLAIVGNGRQQGLVWYSLTTGTITHRHPLPPAPADGNQPMTAENGPAGETIIMIGDRVYRVEGTEVESKRLRVDPTGVTGAW